MEQMAERKRQSLDKETAVTVISARRIGNFQKGNPEKAEANRGITESREKE